MPEKIGTGVNHAIMLIQGKDQKRYHIMICGRCNTELIWGGDHDYEDYSLDGDGIVSNYSCSKCDCTVIAYYPND